MSLEQRFKDLDTLSGKEVEEEIIEEKPVEEVVEEIIEEQPLEEIIEEDVVEEIPEKQPKKLEFDLKEFLESNKDTVLKVLTEKDKDYTSLANEEALKLKLQKENPEWDQSDIEAELEEKYAVGLTKITIDPETMDDDEIKEAKAFNKKIDAANRLLKKDGKSAIQYLSDLNKDVELPKFEYTFEESEEKETAKPEDIIEQYHAQLQEQSKKQKEEQWIPDLKKALEAVSSVQKEVKYVDDGNEVVLNVDYKPSKEEKEEIQKQLEDYIAQPSDEKYIKDGVVDVQGFVQDKTEVLLREKLYRTIAKEAAAKARQKFVKEGLVNYTEEARTTTLSNDNDNSFEKFMLNKKQQN